MDERQNAGWQRSRPGVGPEDAADRIAAWLVEQVRPQYLAAAYKLGGLPEQVAYLVAVGPAALVEAPADPAAGPVGGRR